jgi:hypothetical protein
MTALAAGQLVNSVSARNRLIDPFARKEHAGHGDPSVTVMTVSVAAALG